MLKYFYILYQQCSKGEIAIDISPGLYNPSNRESYAVYDGIVQGAYAAGTHFTKARWDEDVTRFYMTSKSQITISYPSISDIYLSFIIQQKN